MIIQDWKRVLRKAWSIRLILAGGLFAGLEGGVQIMSAFGYLPDWMPRGAFAALAMVANAGAFVTRLIAQKDMHGDDK